MNNSQISSVLYVVKYSNNHAVPFKIVKTESYNDAYAYYLEKKDLYALVELIVETKIITQVRLK